MKKNFDPIIKTTLDYRMFKTLNGNRDVNPNHLRRLKISISDRLLFSPIIVNDKKEVIDGQHRLRVCRELGLPIHYIIVYGYGVKEVQILNANMSNWKKSDYLIGYIKEGKESYLKFKDFQERFSQLSFSTCVKILSGVRGNSDQKGSDKKGGQVGMQMKNFENGNFTIPNVRKSYEIAEKIMDYKPLFDRYNDTTFVVTLLGLFENPNYIHDQMIHKLSLQPNALSVCRSVGQYIIKMEEIFNYKNRNKVSLRY